MNDQKDSELTLKVTLRQLQLFVATADSGSITAAAERLFLSQTAISLALGQLEKALGATLFVRRRAHGMTLTSSGRNLLPLARHILSSTQTLQDEAGGGEGEKVTGLLRIGCFASLGPQMLPGLLVSFQDRHPEADIDFQEGAMGALQPELETGTLDLLLAYDLGIPPELSRQLISQLRPGILISRDHPLARRGEGSLSLRELADEPHIMLESPMSQAHAKSIFEAVGISPRTRFSSQNFETIRSLIGRKLGWTLTMQRPESPVSHEGLGVTVLELNDPEIRPVDVVALWSPHIMLSRAAHAFLQMLQEKDPSR
jgi:DNA-binding transcriptional LysR family regulator